jgi:N-acetylglucosamine malate deacetylase 1
MQRLAKFLLSGFSRAARPYLKTYGLLQTAKVFNRSALVWEPAAETVLVLAPHIDDDVMGCGGTLAKHVARGASVTVAFLTDCGAGGALGAGERSAEALTAARKREAYLALAELGIRHLEFLDAKDGSLTSTPALVQQLRAILQGGRFDLVYLPFFVEAHPDHRATSRILLDAALGTHLQFQCLGYEVWTPLLPNCLVNIDATEQLKRKAIRHYRSQLAEADYVHTQLGLNAYRSSAFFAGTCRYAEAFCALSLDRYRDLHDSYIRS